MGTGREEFIKEVERLIAEDILILSEAAGNFYNNFKNITEEEKPQFTENGKRILVFMKNSEKELWKAKELADALQFSSRSVSGSCRKLVADGFVDKVGKDPVIYTLSSKGKDIIIEEGENE